ncbi:MAG: type II secretion system protein [Planctomycetota bacterium]
MPRRSGFTLIELIAVLVLLAILSAVAIPQYMDLRLRAQTSQLEGVLSSVREGLHQWHMSEIMAPTGETSWAAIVRPGAVIEGGLPPNPFNELETVYAFGTASNIVDLVETNRYTTASSFPRGYVYFGTNTPGEYGFSFYANTTEATSRVEPSSGVALTANQL